MTNSQRPLDDGDWWAFRFLLHALGGVFRGRVLLLTVVGLLIAELGVWILAGLGPESLELLFISSRVGDLLFAPLDLALAGYKGQVDYWHAFATPFFQPTFLSVTIGVWRIVVWSLFGAAIARLAALHMTLHDLPSASDVLKRAWTPWWSHIASVLAMLGVLGLLVGVIWLVGKAPQVSLLIAVTGPIALLLATIATIVALGLAFGWPLMIASSAVERSDPFDAISCGFAYVYQRPLRLLAYGLQAMLVASAAGALAQLMTRTLLAIAAEWWMSTGGMAEFWLRVASYLPLVFHAAYFWFAAVAIYLLMRREIDEKQADEVFLDDEGGE